MASKLQPGPVIRLRSGDKWTADFRKMLLTKALVKQADNYVSRIEAVPLDKLFQKVLQHWLSMGEKTESASVETPSKDSCKFEVRDPGILSKNAKNVLEDKEEVVKKLGLSKAQLNFVKSLYVAQNIRVVNESELPEPLGAKYEALMKAAINGFDDGNGNTIAFTESELDAVFEGSIKVKPKKEIANEIIAYVKKSDEPLELMQKLMDVVGFSPAVSQINTNVDNSTFEDTINNLVATD